MYKIHRDTANNKWNVFRVLNGREEFIRAFDELEDARDFCDINNGLAQVLNAGAVKGGE